MSTDTFTMAQFRQRRRGLACVSVVAHISALATFAMTTGDMVYEANSSGSSLAYGTFFNHPFVATMGFACFSTFAVLSFFTYEHAFGMNHTAAKYLHFFWQTCAVAAGTASVANMYAVHENAGAAHFQTLHSWLGIFVLALYWLQYFLGALVFLVKSVSVTIKKSFLATHVIVGLTSTFGVYVVILLGLLYHNPGLSGDAQIYRDLNLAGIAMFVTVRACVCVRVGVHGVCICAGVCLACPYARCACVRLSHVTFPAKRRTDVFA